MADLCVLLIQERGGCKNYLHVTNGSFTWRNIDGATLFKVEDRSAAEMYTKQADGVLVEVFIPAETGNNLPQEVYRG